MSEDQKQLPDAEKKNEITGWHTPLMYLTIRIQA